MILRPLEPENPPSGKDRLPVWKLVEQSQSRSSSRGSGEFWMITQPAHAALSGEIAEKLSPSTFPGLNETLCRAFALHDAGWGPADAEAIQVSRAVLPGKNAVLPRSFLDYPASDVEAAWTGSIDTVEKLSPLGGYLVSRHFLSICQDSQAGGRHKAGPEGKLLMRFAEREKARQGRLLAKISTPEADIGRLFEALQFCDLLSLYISCGLQQAAVFPQAISGKYITLLPLPGGKSCRLEPSPFRAEEVFSVSAIRHPRLRSGGPNSALFAMAIIPAPEMGR